MLLVVAVLFMAIDISLMFHLQMFICLLVLLIVGVPCIDANFYFVFYSWMLFVVTRMLFVIDTSFLKNRLIFLRPTRLLAPISRAINFSSETVSIKITIQHFLISARKCLTRFKWEILLVAFNLRRVRICHLHLNGGNAFRNPMYISCF